ncbi:MAG TPA: alpha/beta hydrolase [Acidimicrobiales bacterium]|jgi:acetyl esterase/lipase|nr:alpha/beta hydrolase [Acidimicrobiales bacterium]
MVSAEMTEMLALIPTDFADPSADYHQVRAMLAPFHGHAVPSEIVVREAVFGGVRAAWYEYGNGAPDEGVAFHCHGGGLVSCPLDAYHFYGAMLVEQLGLRVVQPDYRLAPEHPYPAAQEDCLAAYEGLIASGIDTSKLVVMGDSCGGGLALTTLIGALQKGLPMPACFVSVSGWFDLSVADPNEGAGDPFLTAQWVRNRGMDYTQGRVPLDDPSVSPAYADLAGLPPLFLPVGQHDTLREGVLQLAAAAMEAGVAVTIESWPGAVHGWQGLVGVGVPEATAIWARTRTVIHRSFERAASGQ